MPKVTTFEKLLPCGARSSIGSREQPVDKLYVERIYACKINDEKIPLVGVQGFTGKKGKRGDNGKRGCQGIGGEKGCRGKRGHTGPQGKSQKGAQGIEGKSGSQGAQGAQSQLPGPQGSFGYQGEDGSQGLGGMQGSEGGGNDGAQGNGGPQGNVGLRGVQGPVGESNGGGGGTQGFQGLPGEGAQGIEGLPGVQGPPGDGGGGGGGTQGFQGVPGEGAQGMEGLPGVQGPPGDGGGGGNGPQGFQGLRGSDGSSAGGGGAQGQTTVSFRNGGPQQPTSGPVENVVIDIANGNFFSVTDHSQLDWTLVFDDSFDAANLIIDACLSNDGQKMFVQKIFTGFGNVFYRSLDGTWNAPSQVGPGSKTWTGVACGAAGDRVLAVTNGDLIYQSTNSFTSFTPRGISNAWTDVCMSQDGLVAVAVGSPSQIFYSADGGDTWIPTAVVANWNHVACSQSGEICLATTSTQVWMSIDSGVTWALSANIGFIETVSVGKPLLAGPSALATFLLKDATGTIYRSIDQGATYVQLPTPSIDYAISSSSEREFKSASSTVGSYSTNFGANFIDNNLLPISSTFSTGGSSIKFSNNGNWILLLTNSKQRLIKAQAVQGETQVFNSLVSNTAVTAKLLTDLVPIPGSRILPTDSILEMAGKVLSAESFPVGICVVSQLNTTFSIAVPQSSFTFIGGASPGVFLVGSEDLTNLLDFNSQSGQVTYLGTFNKSLCVSAGFSYRALSGNPDVQFSFNANASGLACCTVTPQTFWQRGQVQQRMLLAPNATVQLGSFQTALALLNLEITAIVYNLTS